MEFFLLEKLPRMAQQFLHYITKSVINCYKQWKELKLKIIIYLCLFVTSLLFYIPNIESFSYKLILLLLSDAICCYLMMAVIYLSYKVYMQTKRRKVQYLFAHTANKKIEVFVKAMIVLTLLFKNILIINALIVQALMINSCILMGLFVELAILNNMIYIVDGKLNSIHFSIEIERIKFIKVEHNKSNFKITIISSEKEYSTNITEYMLLHLRKIFFDKCLVVEEPE